MRLHGTMQVQSNGNKCHGKDKDKEECEDIATWLVPAMKEQKVCDAPLQQQAVHGPSTGWLPRVWSLSCLTSLSLTQLRR